MSPLTAADCQDLDGLPEPLVPLLADTSPKVRAAAGRALGASRFIRDLLLRDLDRAQAWLGGDALEAPLDAAALSERLASAENQDDQHYRELRRVRNEGLLRIAFRDIAGWADVEETLESLTRLAELCCTSAARAAFAAVERRFGTPRDESGKAVAPVILAMGKLGGRELNFSSDVDLICCYTGEGETDGSRPASNAEFFEKFVQEFTRRLSLRTADGFVYRVDWMLRPFGASGPPAVTLAAAEEYYQVHGREWERYALIKARPLAGDLQAGQRLLDALRPFVYRRYLDFNAVGSLRELKRKIAEDVARRGQEDNIKLGPGGIREIEFIVQAFQLIRGGQELRLRDARLLPVLRYLGEAEHLEPSTAAELERAYRFLRRVENGIQMYADEQAHRLPGDEDARRALCAALGFNDWAKLGERLGQVRRFVQAEFDRVFSDPVEERESVLAPLLRGVRDASPEAGAQLLERAGFSDRAAAVRQELDELLHSRMVKSLPEGAQAKLLALLPVLMEDVLREKDPDTAALRALRVVSAIAGRSTYLTLLRESATARAQLIRLCAASPWTTDLIAQSPILLDQLLDPRSLYAPPDRMQMRSELDQVIGNCAPEDTEGLMNALRRYRQETMLRVAAADLVKALPLVKVSDRLTWLAETIVEKTLQLTEAEMRSLYGEPRRADGSPAQFAVIAYGKFGGLEMGYGSDLDIVFLHDCDALEAETAGGPRSIPNEVWLARLAQRIINWIATQTSAGRCYEVDLELRPDGRRGLTVNSLQAFEAYQKTQAWTWEHQALTRARAVAGSPALQAAFERIRREVLMRERESERLRKDILDMRSRMREHLEKRMPGKFDVKHGRGGLTDIEFITQYLVLREAARHPDLVTYSDNWRQTEALIAAGVLPPEAGKLLIEVYRTYRGWLHEADLQGAERHVPERQVEELASGITRLWAEILKS